MSSRLRALSRVSSTGIAVARFACHLVWRSAVRHDLAATPGVHAHGAELPPGALELHLSRALVSTGGPPGIRDGGSCLGRERA